MADEAKKLSDLPPEAHENLQAGMDVPFACRVVPAGANVIANPSERKIAVALVIGGAGVLHIELPADETTDQLIELMRDGVRQARSGLVAAKPSDVDGISKITKGIAGHR